MAGETNDPKDFGEFGPEGKAPEETPPEQEGEGYVDLPYESGSADPQPLRYEQLGKTYTEGEDFADAQQRATEGDPELAEAKTELSTSTEERRALRERHGAVADGVSLKRDADGYYVRTHRARSKSHPTVGDIPKDTVTFIESTG